MQYRVLGVVFGVLACSCGGSKDQNLGGAVDSGGVADAAATNDATAKPGEDSGPIATADGGPVGVDAGEVDAAVDSSVDAAPVGFQLTSTALADGATFAKDNTCDGTDSSPPFAWTAGPTGTLSYAIVLTDTTNKLVHWAIYDIAPTPMDTPPAIARQFQPPTPAGSRQAKSYIAARAGYAGPCPPVEHVYELALYAVDIAKLPNTSAATTKEQIVALLGAHKLAVAKLTGKYKKVP